MKKLVFTLVMCLMALMAQAQVSRTIANTAGSLETNLGADLPNVTDLTVTGTMDARDFKIIRDNMPALVNVDLSNSSILEWNGTGGTSLTVFIKYNANQIPTRAFYDGNPIPSTKLKSIKLPFSTTNFGTNAFNYCQGLDSLFIPSTVVSLITNALNYCSANYRVDITNTQYGSIDGVLFRKSGGLYTQLIQYPTSKLGGYTIPDGITSINSAAFAGNLGLNKVVIPASIGSIASSNIFAGCTNLSQIKINAQTPLTISPTTFPSEIYPTCKLIVPKNATAAYRGALYWQNFINIVEPFTMVDTKAATSITNNSATLNADIVSFGDSTISAHGFCWNTTGNPTINNQKIDKGAAISTGAYNHIISNLISNQKYYARAYVTNETRTVYAQVVQFTTLPAFELTTNAATSVLIKTATLNGNITYTEPTEISNYGFCWNTTGTPTIANSKEDLGVNPTAGVFTKNVIGLNGASTYYYRSFATANGNTVYGTQQSFTTALPDDYDITVQINGNGTVSSGTTISNGALVNVLRGATKTFTITPNAGYQITAVTYNGVDVFSQVTNNQYTTPAVNAYGTFSVSFGNNIKTINVATAGTLSTLLSAIDKSIITNLTVTSNIDATDFVTMRDAMPLLAVVDLSGVIINAYNGGSGTASWINTYPINEIPIQAFSFSYQGKPSLETVILPNTLTSIQSAAFNSCTGLTQITFPSSVISIKDGSFYGCSGLKTIKSLNSTPPAIETEYVFNGANISFVYVPIGKVAAYKAASGWSSFNIVEYKLKPTTKSVSSIKLTSAKLTGSLDVITDSPVTAHGFCWNTTGTPTLADSKVDNGATTTEGTYSNIIDNLSGATTYYVRAYATDGTSGTVYSTEEISFTTAEIPATSSLSGNYYNSQYWPKSKSPYTIAGNVNLAEGTTLTIEPGVVVNFAGAYEIMTMGNIVANGNATDSITFNANGNICTFLDFKNAKLGDSELSYLKMIGHKIMPPLFAKALKTQGTCTDSLVLNNVRIETSEINCGKNVRLKNSNLNNIKGGFSTINFENCSLYNSDFGETSSFGYLNLTISNSAIKAININGNSANANAIISNSILLNSNFYNVSGKIQKSKLLACSINSAYYNNPVLKIDSTFILKSSVYLKSANLMSGNSSVSNCIITKDSTQTLQLNNSITKCLIIGSNNKIGGIGLDAVSGTITNSTIVNHRIGLQTSALTINNSNFINKSQYAIKNTGATSIDAKSNYWGVGNTNSDAIKAKIWDYYRDMNLGKVAYDNYLTSPNTDAPITPPQNFRKMVATTGVNYTWNASPEADIKGYKLYSGAFDGFTFANVMDLGNVTSYTLPTASINDTVLVTAYDLLADGKEDMLEGHESWYSEDVIMPAKAGSISGLTTVCQGKKTVSYSVPTIANATSYRWTLPTGATGTSSTRTITVDYSLAAVSGKVTVRGVNEYGEGDSTFVAVTVNSLPDKAGPLSGATSVCQGEKALVYRIAPIPGATSYSWTLPEGVTGVSDADTIKVNFSRTAKSAKIRVKGINACGAGVDSAITITMKPLPVIVGQITGSTTVCAGEQAKVFKIAPVANVTSYSWTLPTGVVGTSFLDSIVVDFATTAKSGEIKVVALNDCGASDTVKISITVKPLLGSIGEITGENAVCAGTKALTYSIPAVENALSYEWTLPTGVTGTSTTKSITVDFGIVAESGNIKVKAINDCGKSALATLAITIKQPTASTTKAKVCSKELPYVWNATNYNKTGIYTKTFVNAAGCDSIATLDLTVIASPATPIITRTDYTLKSSADVGNQWYNSAGAINGAVNQEYIVTANEEYYVIVTTNGCSSDVSNKIRVDNTAVQKITAKGSFKIYPNPVHNELRLEYDGNARFEILNLVGQVLYNGILVKTALVETSHLFPGVYLIRFTQGKTVTTERFIKK